MKRLATITISIGLGVALAAAALNATTGVRSTVSGVLTDGGEIRVPVAGAPLREVLWSPAEPVRGAGFGATDEYEPGVSADGTTLVFVRRRAGTNADLYQARWSPTGWSEPTPLEAVNTEADELGPELSRDGTALYFYSDRTNGLGGYDLWVSRASGGGWGSAINLGPRVNSPWNEYGPALAPAADRLYFSSNRPRPGGPPTPVESWRATVREQRTRHDYDLYSAALRDGAPADATPIALLSTPADEGAPELSPSGDFLYFTSDRVGAGGLGGFDLYRTRVSRSGALGATENLGGAVNTPANDLDPAISSDGFRLCFSSDRVIQQRGAEDPPATADAEGRVGRYALWSSVSREVYRDADILTSAPSTAWSDLWPWLLAATLLMLLTALLVRLLRDQRWRRRFGRLSLIAQCVLLSLLVHAGIASLLTIWKVGSGIIDLIQKEGGGSRVVLASGTPGGSIVAQVRGVVMSESAALPGLTSIVASIPTEPLEVPLMAANLPELVAPASSVLPAPEENRAHRDPQPSVPVDRIAAATSSAAAAIPRSADPERAQLEPTTQTTLPDLASGVAPSMGVPADADVARTTVDPPPMRVQDERPLIAPYQPATEDRETPASLSDSSAALPPASAQDTAAPALPSIMATATSRPEAEAALPGSPVMAPKIAPVPGSVSSGRVELRLQPMEGARGVRGGEGLRAELVPSARPGVVEDRVTAGALPSPAGPGPTEWSRSVLPRLASERPESGQEASLRGAPLGGVPIAAAPPGAVSTTTAGSGMAMIDLGRMSDLASRIGAPSIDTPSTSGSSAGRGRGLTSTPIPEPIGRPEARIPAEPVAPVETFAQRAPEARQELVEKMGGSAETERAVGLALDWFARHQEPDGHWSAEHFDDRCGQCGGPAEFDADAAMTGMALLCYLGAGHTHVQAGPYRDVVDRGITWLVSRQSPVGDLRRGETMYGQTVATVALCEALAMTRDPSLSAPARKAVEFVLSRASGEQRTGDRETSVLGWLVFTVESARRAGIDVPRGTFDSAAAWLDYVMVRGSPGVYSYAAADPPSAAMTAEAMFVRQLLGHTRDESMMKRSAAFILQTPPAWKEDAPTFYWYYATLALFQHQGASWARWNEALVGELLSHQQREGPSAGSWQPQDQWSRMGGRIYQTAVCTLCLEVYYRYKTQ